LVGLIDQSRFEVHFQVPTGVVAAQYDSHKVTTSLDEKRKWGGIPPPPRARTPIAMS
jgi:hypothetical protein